MKQKLYWLQSVILAGGSIFTWYTIYHDFDRFFSAGYTVTTFTGCSVPNPLATACFYGGIAFVVAFIWSLKIAYHESSAWQTLQQSRLWWLLTAGIIFAWSNFGLVVYRFAQNSFQPTQGCSAVVIQTPFESSCFYGASIFLLAFIVGTIVKKMNKKKEA